MSGLFVALLTAVPVLLGAWVGFAGEGRVH